MYTIDKFFPDIQECIDNFCIQMDHNPLSEHGELLYSHAINEHKQRFLDLLLTRDEKEIELKTDELIQFTIDHEIPYIFIYGELVTVARKLLGNLIKSEQFDHLQDLNHYFALHEERIIHRYLAQYLEQIKVKYTTRLIHIDSLDEKKLISYYEHHLHWMINLVDYIQQSQYDDHHPELRHTHCEFGKWLHATNIPYIITTSHFKIVEKLHLNLHDLASIIVSVIVKKSDATPLLSSICCNVLIISHWKSEMKLLFSMKLKRVLKIHLLLFLHDAYLTRL